MQGLEASSEGRPSTLPLVEGLTTLQGGAPGSGLASPALPRVYPFPRAFVSGKNWEDQPSQRARLGFFPQWGGGSCRPPPPVTLIFMMSTQCCGSAIVEETQGHLVSKWPWVLAGSPFPQLPCGI